VHALRRALQAGARQRTCSAPSAAQNAAAAAAAAAPAARAARAVSSAARPAAAAAASSVGGAPSAPRPAPGARRASQTRRPASQRPAAAAQARRHLWRYRGQQWGTPLAFLRALETRQSRLLEGGADLLEQFSRNAGRLVGAADARALTLTLQRAHRPSARRRRCRRRSRASGRRPSRPRTRRRAAPRCTRPGRAAGRPRSCPARAPGGSGARGAGGVWVSAVAIRRAGRAW